MASPRLRAFVLAAGLGTRLRPLTERVAKPLVRVAGRPLLGRVIERLRRAGVSEIGVNAHHLAGQVEAFVRSLPDAGRVTLFHEPEILGTGGALANARAFLAASDPFLLHNGDVLTDADPGALLEAHRRSGALATLLVTDHAPENKVLVSAGGEVLDLLGRLGAAAPKGSRLATYTGLAALSPDFLGFLPGRGYASLVDALLAAVRERPGLVRALAPGTLAWSDLGTIEQYLEVLEVVRSRGFGPALTVTPLAEQGSDRVFYRLVEPGRSEVLMLWPGEDPDFERYLEINAFLHARGLGAPAILAADRADRAVVLEDLGGTSLYGLVRDEEDEEQVEALYRQAIDLLVALQVRGAQELAACPAAAARALDHDGLRWETDYFRANFLEKLAGLDPAGTAALDDEFERLAAAAAAQPVVFIHRDFQSQNLLVTGGRVRVVDFQGARRGPLLYDLASLLMDPYVELDAPLRGRLAEHWRVRLAGAGGPRLPQEECAAFLLAAGLQRGMQALGAYAFLTLVKGRRSFREFVEPGLRLLEEGLRELGRSGALPGPLPRLAAAVARAREKGPFFREIGAAPDAS